MDCKEIQLTSECENNEEYDQEGNLIKRQMMEADREVRTKKFNFISEEVKSNVIIITIIQFFLNAAVRLYDKKLRFGNLYSNETT